MQKQHLHGERLVWYTSLVLMPPPDQWSAFVEIKKHHMNPRIKRPPFPHITLLAPFFEPSKFDQAKAELTEALQSLEPFNIKFEKFELFRNGQSSTLYLDPIVTPSDALDKLYNIVSNCYPQCVEANTKNEDGFAPHIGVGYFKNLRVAQELQSKYQTDWKPIEFLVKEIYILSRTGQDDPFEVRAVVPIRSDSTKPYFDTIPIK